MCKLADYPLFCDEIEFGSRGNGLNEDMNSMET